MANVLLGNSLAGVDTPTLGDITAAKIRLVMRNCTITTSGTEEYIVSQGSSSGFTRELAFYKNNGAVKVAVGGENTDLFDLTTDYPTGITNETIDLTVETNGNFSVTVGTDTPITGNFARGVSRVDGIPFKLGGRGSTAGNSEIVSPIEAGTKLGDVLLYLDDVLVRSYAMPPDGNLVIDHKNGQNGTVIESNGINFESVTKDALAPTITLVESALEVVEIDAAYTNQGATATDPTDGTITVNVITTGTIDLTAIGRYKLIHYITNSLFFTEQVTQYIAVRPPFFTVPSDVTFVDKDFPDLETLLATFQVRYDEDDLTKDREFYSNEFAFGFNSWLRFFTGVHTMTGETTYLDQGITLIDFMISRTDDLLPAGDVISYRTAPVDVYHAVPFVPHIGWSRDDNGRTVLVLDDGMICRNIMLFVDYLKTNNITTYDAKLEAYIDKCEAVMAVHDNNWGYYRYGGDGVTELEPNSIVIHGTYWQTNRENPGGWYSNPIGNNQTSGAVYALYLINKYRPDAEHINKFRAHIDFMVSRMEDYDTYFVWQYGYQKDGTRLTLAQAEDLNHGSYSMDTFLTARREGWIDSTVFEKIADCLLVCVNQNGTSSHLVDGTGSDDGADLKSLAYGFLEAAHEYSLPDIQHLVGESLMTHNNAARVTYGLPFFGVANVMRLEGITGSTPTLNLPPIVSAGADRTVSSAEDSITTQLTGTASDPNVGQSLTHLWTSDAGQQVSIAGGTTLTPTVILPVNDAEQTIIFTLTSTDDDTYAPLSTSDSMVITILPKVYNSTVAMNIDNGSTIPDGDYDVRFSDATTGEHITDIANVTFTNGLASELVPVAIGTNVEYRIRTVENFAGGVKETT